MTTLISKTIQVAQNKKELITKNHYVNASNIQQYSWIKSIITSSILYYYIIMLFSEQLQQNNAQNGFVTNILKQKHYVSMLLLYTVKIFLIITCFFKFNIYFLIRLALSINISNDRMHFVNQFCHELAKIALSFFILEYFNALHFFFSERT